MRQLWTFVTLLILPLAAPAEDSAPFDGPLALGFEVIDNHHDAGQSFKAAWTLTNHDASTLKAQDWELYFNFGRMILPESLSATNSLSATVEATHVNGDLFKLTPTADFKPLAPGAHLRIPFTARHWLIKEGEAPAGAYLVPAPGATPIEVPVNVAPLVARRQTDRMVGDGIQVPTPASTHAENQALTPLDREQIPRLLPTPLRLETGDGHVHLDASWRILHDEKLVAEAKYLVQALEPLLGASLETVSAAESPSATSIVLRSKAGAVAESYRLTIRADNGIQIDGGGASGVFYGIQSLRGLLPLEAEGSDRPALRIDEITVDDAPRFGYRGLHLDVARNFQSKETVLELLDLMATFKLNRFHFHLTDDEGWRLEIPALPELTEVGGRRGHTTDESDRLLPSFGSGPDPKGSHGSGHYTRSDFVEILRHAHVRHIEVIPEIDVPGHARAAIKSMEARHGRLLARGKEAQARAHLLSEAADASEYMSVQMWKDNVINVCLPSTYTFLKTIVDEIVDQYAEAGVPLTALHTGGDEVPGGVWKKSPACEQLVRETEELGGVDDLPIYFLQKVARLLGEAGLITAGWEEIALIEEQHGDNTSKTVNPAFLERKFQPYVWNNVWGWGAEDVGYRLANTGYKIVLSNATNLYFDLAYNKDPREPGYYWAGLVDTKKPYTFVPLDLYKNARHDLMGRPLDPDAFSGHARLTTEGRRNVLGIQGQIWAENAKGPSMMEYLTFPKLLGLAERAWAAQPGWARIEDTAERERALAVEWNKFAHRLGHYELPRLDTLYGGVDYRLPTPGAVVEGGQLRANVAFPGLDIRYTTDGSEPTKTSTLYTGPVDVKGAVRLKSFDQHGRGSLTAILPEAP